MSIAVIAGNRAFSSCLPVPLTSLLSTQFFTLMICYFKGLFACATSHASESAKLWGDSGMLGGEDRISGTLYRVIVPKK